MINLEELLRSSMMVFDGMPTTAEPLSIGEAITYDCENCFCMNNGIIGFVHKHTVYVMPYTREAYASLEELFQEKTFTVPFSTGLSMPIGRKAAEWIYLKNKAEKIRQKDHEEDCKKWAKEHNIEEINTSNLFRIPERGLEVINRFGETSKEYPIDTSLECVSRVGLFGCNNGILVLVNTDGHTYVTKGFGLVKELEQKGFKDESIHAPFSNGEEIIDPILAAEWDHIIRK